MIWLAFCRACKERKIHTIWGFCFPDWGHSGTPFTDQSRYAPSQWEKSLQCNNVSHWLGAYLDWFLPFIETRKVKSPKCLQNGSLNISIRTIDTGVITSLCTNPLKVFFLLNSFPPSAAYVHHWIRPALFQIMTCHLFSAKPLSKLKLGNCQLDS